MDQAGNLHLRSPSDNCILVSFGKQSRFQSQAVRDGVDGTTTQTPVPETATYNIKQGNIPDSAMCECGHSFAAHGSKGMICAGCRCVQFKQKEDKS